MTYLTRRATLARRCRCPCRRLAPPCPAAAGADPGGRRDAAEIRDRERCEAARAAPLQVRPGRRDALPREHEEVHRARPASRSPSTARAGRTCGRRRPSPPMSAAGPTSCWPGRRTRTCSPTSCSPLTDLADYLGKKYGGWFPVAEIYGKSHGRPVDRDAGRRQRQHHGLPQVVGERGRLRRGAGRLPGLPRALPGAASAPATRRASRSATRSATAAGPTGCCGASTRRWSTRTTRSSSTIRKTHRGPRLRQGSSTTTFIPGTLSWLDPSNNKAFLAGECGLTSNGISVYYAAKNSQDAGVKALAQDIEHADFPVGPVGKPDPGRAGHQLDRLRLHALPERRARVSPLHDGAGAVRALAAGEHRLLVPSARRPTTPTRSGPTTRKVDALSRRHAQRAAAELQGQAQPGRGRGQGRHGGAADVRLGLRRPGHAKDAAAEAQRRGRALLPQGLSRPLRQGWPGRQGHLSSITQGSAPAMPDSARPEIALIGPQRPEALAGCSSPASPSTTPTSRPTCWRRCASSARASAVPPRTAWPASPRAQIEALPKLEICAINGVGLETSDLAAAPRARRRRHHHARALRRRGRPRDRAGARRLPPHRRRRPLRPRRLLDGGPLRPRAQVHRHEGRAASGWAGSASRSRAGCEAFKCEIGYVDPVPRDVPYKRLSRRSSPSPATPTSCSSAPPAGPRAPARRSSTAR